VVAQDLDIARGALALKGRVRSCSPLDDAGRRLQGRHRRRRSSSLSSMDRSELGVPQARSSMAATLEPLLRRTGFFWNLLSGQIPRHRCRPSLLPRRDFLLVSRSKVM
jgi:hypothetical protein